MSIFYLDYENGSDAASGADWANAWKTFELGATAARIAPGDVIRVAKSPAPTALAGTTASWTNLSKTVTLNTAETATIDNCETAWTAQAGADTTVARVANGKQGSYYARFTLDASPQTSILQAYYPIGSTLDLSGYQKISFWMLLSGAVIANNWRIALCSDTAGATPVDYFEIPPTLGINTWICMTITKTGGGNLGSAIQSIAVYTGSDVTGIASKYLAIDNVIACTTSGLNLQSLISKNNLEQGGDEAWYGIQSIDGTTVLLDNHTMANASQGRGYYGTTETVNTYKRETIKTIIPASSGTLINRIVDSGTIHNNIEFLGGWNTSTTTQDGETYFDGLSINGTGIYSSSNFITLKNFHCYRYGTGINIVGTNFYGDNLSASNCNASDGSMKIGSRNGYIGTILAVNNNRIDGLIINNGTKRLTIDTIKNVNNNLSYGISDFGDLVTYGTIRVAGNNLYDGLYGGGSKIGSIVTASNGSYGIEQVYGNIIINNATIGEANPFNHIYLNAGNLIKITKFNGNYAYIDTDGGHIESQASTLTAGSGTEWKFVTEDTTDRQLAYPLKLTVAKIACTASNLVTVKMYFKKGHSTNIGARLVFPAQLGASATYTECPNDTNENEVTITFTPTEAGVAEIEAWAYYVAGHSTVIVDKLTITQA